MQLEVKPYELPQPITFNFDELKAALTAKVHDYEVMVYTDDQIKQAKADRADLNRLKKALQDERIRREKEYLEPFNDFKSKVNEIIAIIDKPASIIDQRVKEYEQMKKEEKRKDIENIFIECELPKHVTLEKIFDESWLNASVSLTKIREAILTFKKHDDENTSMLAGLNEYSLEALEVYKTNLNVAEALTTANKLAALAKAKRDAEANKPKEEPKAEEPLPFTDKVEEVAEEEKPEEEESVYITFKVRGNFTTRLAVEFKAFCDYHKIEIVREK